MAYYSIKLGPLNIEKFCKLIDNANRASAVCGHHLSELLFTVLFKSKNFTETVVEQP